MPGRATDCSVPSTKPKMWRKGAPLAWTAAAYSANLFAWTLSERLPDKWCSDTAGECGHMQEPEQQKQEGAGGGRGRRARAEGTRG